MKAVITAIFSICVMLGCIVVLAGRASSGRDEDKKRK